MMTQLFFSAAFVLGCFVLHVPGFALEQTAGRNRAFASDVSVTGNHFFLSAVLDDLDTGLSEEKRARKKMRIWGFKKYRTLGPAGEADESIAKHKLSRYIFYARFHILRVDGSVLIFPFHYYW